MNKTKKIFCIVSTLFLLIISCFAPLSSAWILTNPVKDPSFESGSLGNSWRVEGLVFISTVEAYSGSRSVKLDSNVNPGEDSIIHYSLSSPIPVENITDFTVYSKGGLFNFNVSYSDASYTIRYGWGWTSWLDYEILSYLLPGKNVTGFELQVTENYQEVYFDDISLLYYAPDPEPTQAPGRNIWIDYAYYLCVFVGFISLGIAVTYAHTRRDRSR